MLLEIKGDQGRSREIVGGDRAGDRAGDRVGDRMGDRVGDCVGDRALLREVAGSIPVAITRSRVG